MNENQSRDFKIIEELKRRAVDVKFGMMTVEFCVKDGKIVAGVIKNIEIKLG